MYTPYIYRWIYTYIYICVILFSLGPLVGSLLFSWSYYCHRYQRVCVYTWRRQWMRHPLCSGKRAIGWRLQKRSSRKPRTKWKLLWTTWAESHDTPCKPTSWRTTWRTACCETITWALLGEHIASPISTECQVKDNLHVAKMCGRAIRACRREDQEA